MNSTHIKSIDINNKPLISLHFKTGVILVAYFCFLSLLVGQTYLNGSLPSYIEANEYIVDGDITIDAGNSSHIEAGTKFLFELDNLSSHIFFFSNQIKFIEPMFLGWGVNIFLR